MTPPRIHRQSEVAARAGGGAVPGEGLDLLQAQAHKEHDQEQWPPGVPGVQEKGNLTCKVSIINRQALLAQWIARRGVKSHPDPSCRHETLRKPRRASTTGPEQCWPEVANLLVSNRCSQD